MRFQSNSPLACTNPAISTLPASPNQAQNLALLRSWSNRHGCLDAMACDECLGQVASSLALAVGYSLERARMMTAAEFQSELGAEICDMERARELKWMTTRACYTEDIPDPGSAVWVPRQPVSELHASRSSAGSVGVWERVSEWLGAHPFEFGVLSTLGMLSGLWVAARIGGRLWR